MAYYLATMLQEGQRTRPRGYPLEPGLRGVGIVYDRGDGPKLIRVDGPPHRSWVKLAEDADEPLSTPARRWFGLEGRLTFAEAVGQWLRPQLQPTVEGRYEIWCGDAHRPLWTQLLPLSEHLPLAPTLVVRDFWPEPRHRECLRDLVGYLPTVSVLSLGLLLAVGLLPPEYGLVAVGALPVTDTFTNANGTTLAAHNANWTVMSAAAADMEIQSNAASPNAVGRSGYRWAGDTFDSNMYSQGIYNLVSGGAKIGPAVRCQTGAHSLYGYTGNGTSSEMERLTAGTPTTLGSGPGNAATDAFRISANGSTIRGEKNGALDTGITGNPFTDTNHTGGQAGLNGNTSNNSNQFDTWEAGNLIAINVQTPIASLFMPLVAG